MRALASALPSLAPLPVIHGVLLTSLPHASQLARIALESKALVVLTGAGVSTASGIPDYRSPGRTSYTPLQHKQFVEDERVRKRYWARSYIGYPRMAGAQPNSGHTALVALERRRARAGGAVASTMDIITQNVDSLHRAAGSGSVLELHGSLRSVSCLECGSSEERSVVQLRMEAMNRRWSDHFSALAVVKPDGDSELPPHAYESFAMPCCSTCRMTKLKPDVTFHGGTVPSALSTAAASLIENCDALLVLGSTCTVWSSFRLARRASERGVPVAVINHGPTRVDSLARFTVDAEVGSALTALVNAE